MAAAQIKKAQNHQTPAGSDNIFEPGQKVLVWREKVVKNRIGEWLGPYVVASFDAAAKIVVVQKDTDSAYELYNTNQVKHFLEPDAAAIDFMKTLHSSIAKYRSEVDLPAYVTEVINNSDPRAHTEKMEQAKRAEVQELLKRGTFKVILRSELPNGANAITARFVLAIKSNADEKVKYKARYVMGGHRDKMKNFLVHGAQTFQPSSARLLLALSSIHGFDVWSTDVKLAYLRSSEPLTRRVFDKNTAPEFELEPEQCFELLRPLYGLSDAGELWHLTLHKNLTNDLDMKQTYTDASLYYPFNRDTLKGLNGSYVDDLLEPATKS